MAAVSGTIPNLIGGVSQQPSDIRPLNTSELLDNVWLSPSIGMITRPCGEYIGKFSDTIGADDYVAQHNINKTSGSYQIAVVNGNVRVMNTMTGEVLPVTVEGSALSYLNSGADARDLGFVTIADTTFIYNKSVIPAVNSVDETGYTGITEEGTQRLNPNLYSTVWVKQRLSGYHHYSVYVNNIERASHLTNDSPPAVIADNLITSLQSGGSVVTASKFGSSHTIIAIKLHNEDDWVEAVSSGGGDTAMQAVNDKVEEFSDLVRSDLYGRMVLVSQSDDESADDYWVWYRNGTWEETYGWGSYEKPLANTMPIVLIDNKNGTFTLKEHEWAGRTVGDADSNPTPTFIGHTINNMFLYKGRMCILAGENFMASRVGKFENFYRSSCTQLLDDDPIDIASPESRGAPMLHAQEFNNTLLLFSKFDQFTITGDNDGFLSPNTVNIEWVNSYNNSEKVSPVHAGPNVIFVDDAGNRNFGDLLEYQVERVFGRQVALSLTDSTPEYIPSGIYKLANSTTDNIILVATEGDRHSLYAYHYYYNNDGKVQAAWNKWTFDGEIYNIDFESDKLLVTYLYEGELTVMGMVFHLNVDDTITDNSVILDQLVSSTELTVSFDGANSTVTLPYNGMVGKTELVVAPSDTSGILPPGREIVPSTIDDNVLTFLDRDLSALKFFIGNTIDTTWVLNSFYIRDDQQVPIQDGRVQLRTVSFLYNNTAHFVVTTKAPSRAAVKSSYTGITIGRNGDPLNGLSLDSGEFRIPAYGESDKVKITVTSTSPWRVRFTSVEWGGSYRPKRRRT